MSANPAFMVYSQGQRKKAASPTSSDPTPMSTNKPTTPDSNHVVDEAWELNFVAWLNTFLPKINENMGEYNCNHCALALDNILSLGIPEGGVKSVSSKRDPMYTQPSYDETGKIVRSEVSNSTLLARCKSSQFSYERYDLSSDKYHEPIIELDYDDKPKNKLHLFQAQSKELFEHLKNLPKRKGNQAWSSLNNANTSYGFIVLTWKKNLQEGHIVNFVVSPNNKVYIIDPQKNDVFTDASFKKGFRDEIFYYNSIPPEGFFFKKEEIEKTKVKVKLEGMEIDQSRQSDSPSPENSLNFNQASQSSHSSQTMQLTVNTSSANSVDSSKSMPVPPTAFKTNDILKPLLQELLSPKSNGTLYPKKNNSHSIANGTEKEELNHLPRPKPRKLTKVNPKLKKASKPKGKSKAKAKSKPPQPKAKAKTKANANSTPTVIVYPKPVSLSRNSSSESTEEDNFPNESRLLINSIPDNAIIARDLSFEEDSSSSLLDLNLLPSLSLLNSISEDATNQVESMDTLNDSLSPETDSVNEEGDEEDENVYSESDNSDKELDFSDSEPDIVYDSLEDKTIPYFDIARYTPQEIQRINKLRAPEYEFSTDLSNVYTRAFLGDFSLIDHYRSFAPLLFQTTGPKGISVIEAAILGHQYILLQKFIDLIDQYYKYPRHDGFSAKILEKLFNAAVLSQQIDVFHYLLLTFDNHYKANRILILHEILHATSDVLLKRIGVTREKVDDPNTILRNVVYGCDHNNQTSLMAAVRKDCTTLFEFLISFDQKEDKDLLHKMDYAGNNILDLAKYLGDRSYYIKRIAELDPSLKPARYAYIAPLTISSTIGNLNKGSAASSSNSSHRAFTSKPKPMKVPLAHNPVNPVRIPLIPVTPKPAASQTSPLSPTAPVSQSSAMPLSPKLPRPSTPKLDFLLDEYAPKANVETNHNANGTRKRKLILEDSSKGNSSALTNSSAKPPQESSDDALRMPPAIYDKNGDPYFANYFNARDNDETGLSWSSNIRSLNDDLYRELFTPLLNAKKDSENGKSKWIDTFPPMQNGLASNSHSNSASTNTALNSANAAAQAPAPSTHVASSSNGSDRAEPMQTDQRDPNATVASAGNAGNSGNASHTENAANHISSGNNTSQTDPDIEIVSDPPAKKRKIGKTIILDD